jgi:predicted RNase H-like HicB family nuclease
VIFYPKALTYLIKRGWHREKLSWRHERYPGLRIYLLDGGWWVYVNEYDTIPLSRGDTYAEFVVAVLNLEERQHDPKSPALAVQPTI